MKNMKYVMGAFVMAALVSTSAWAVEMPKDATSFTKAANDKVSKELNIKDQKDFDDASRGFIATLENPDIKNESGTYDIWNTSDYVFLKNEVAPESVNPSLWRQAQLNMNNGLFKVVDGMYQIRGIDLANMTIVEGKTGIIIIDTLSSKEMSKLGLDLYYKHRPKKPIVAVIYSHSHIDHYGGVRGLIDEKDVKSGKIKLIAPDGFFNAAISENVYAGNAMGRRGLFHTGALLPKSEKGQVDDGLGKTSSIGTFTIIQPNITVKKTGEKMTIDGVEIVFQMAPGTEAPAEMFMYFPQLKVLNTAEDCTHTLHNLYTLRGAEVRDSNAWWKALNVALNEYGKDVQAMVGQHHWPVCDNQNVVQMISDQRDMYKFIHDYSLNLMNKGYTMLEVGEMMKLPETLDKKFYNRGYYGSLNHDAKAVYQKYLGFFSGNPADLYQLPPEQAAKKYVEYMGGAEAIIKQARKDYDAGNYRWVAQVMNHVVFAEPNNEEAKNLEADALEQLGYQTESGTWRNFFLYGAHELRNGLPKIAVSVDSPDTISGMTTEMALDYMGIQMNVDKAEGKKMAFNIQVSEEKYLVELSNSALIYTKDKQVSKPDATIVLTDHSDLAKVVAGEVAFSEQIKNGRIKVTGNQSKFEELLNMRDKFNPNFNVVTP